MKIKSIFAITMGLVLSLSFMAGCAKKPSTSLPESSEGVSSEAPKKAESGQLTAVYDGLLTGVFGDESPTFDKMSDATQIKELTDLDFENEAVKEYIYAMPMMNVQFQIFVGVEAEEGKVADVETMLNTYKDKVLADKEAFPYVDFGLEKAKGAQVITVDNYVFYVCIANTFDDAGEDSQAFIDEGIEKSVGIIKELLKK